MRQLLLLRPALQLDPALDVVHVDDLARRLAREGIEHVGAGGDVVLLLREAVAIDERPLVLPRLALERQPTHGVGLADQLLVGQPHEVEVPPPGRLVLAPVPLQQLGEQPARLLLRRPEGGVGELLGRHARDDVLFDRPDAGQVVGQLLAGLVGLGRGARQAVREETLLRGQLGPAGLEPVAEAQGGHAVVAVVALDVGEDLRSARRLVGAQLEPRLELHDRRAGVAQVPLAPEAVQRLELLDGVALDRRADALADGAEQVDEDAATEQRVDVVLARVVALAQAPHGGGLVRRVVVHVHVGVARAPIDDEVDELLEGPLLGCRV